MLAVLVTGAWVHLPVLRLGFGGDDFECLKHARVVIRDPSQLLAPFGGFRLVNSWLMAANMLVGGVRPFGYHLANIVLYLGCGALLYLVVARLDLPRALCAAVTVLWLCSPYSLDNAQAVSSRHQVCLLACWLGLALVWPGPEQRWRARRLIGAATLALLSLLTKESWVVLPGFALAFDLCLSRLSFWRALRRAAVVSLAPLAYIAVYFAHPAIVPGTYLTGGLAAAARVPHALAVFLDLRELVPAMPALGPAEIVASLAFVGLAGCGWRMGARSIGVGVAFFALPFLPILTVPFLTSRYTTIPLVGFLVVLGGMADALLLRARESYRLALAVTVGALFAAQMALNLVTLQGDLEDAGRLDAVYRRLLAETEAFLPELPRDRALVAVRLDRADPLRELVGSSVGFSEGVLRACQGSVRSCRLGFPAHGRPRSGWRTGVRGRRA